MWDEERNAHLFTNANMDLAQPLIDLISKRGLEMALPEDLPTLQPTATKNCTRPDNVFLSDPLISTLTSCTTVPDARPLAPTISPSTQPSAPQQCIPQPTPGGTGNLPIGQPSGRS
ncbi:Reverse transcriptase from transposon X-element protein [Ceratobasidium theobromae]|uniref:Reverse transcriptase from transposon X-element protein n=1 Tax=Ceratobasidium theobromae TaxID=1582974 RepID=A0A5N5Q7R3_9AGAM|nr:Reverse transcriptase from transposon X-element protein [Ceratobasidium theobromae]